MEVPEVKITVDFLNSLSGQFFSDFDILNEFDIPPDGYSLILNNLPLAIEYFDFKGKFIYGCLTNRLKSIKIYVEHNIKSGGYWTIMPDKWCKWCIRFENSSVFFRDTKNSSKIKFTYNFFQIENILKNLGINILDSSFSINIWLYLINSHKEKNVTVFLTDQTIISGCGNYIKCEVLNYAGISPFKKICELSEGQVFKLYEGLRVIPRLSYVYKGLSFSFKNPNGKKGLFCNFLKVYKQKQSKKNRTPDGLVTFWNNNLQN